MKINFHPHSNSKYSQVKSSNCQMCIVIFSAIKSVAGATSATAVKCSGPSAEKHPYRMRLPPPHCNGVFLITHSILLSFAVLVSSDSPTWFLQLRCHMTSEQWLSLCYSLLELWLLVLLYPSPVFQLLVHRVA